jgi:small ligand-binding sensory domain FIST
VFGDEGVELRAIRDALGEVPLIGFFAGGEISNQVLYGYTGVLILFF